MDVTSPDPDRRRTRHRSLAAVWMLALAGAGGLAQAAGFDEKLKAPMMTSAAQTYAQAKEFGARYREVHTANPSQVITNASLAREKFDLKWQVERAIDQRKPITGFEELGFESIGNGSYRVDLNDHPEWDDFPAGIIGVLADANLDTAAPTLIQRGFRPEDVSRLKNYVATHNPRVAAKTATPPIALQFANVVRKFDKARRPVPDALVFSYLYQTSRALSEADRQWVADLLDEFDAQRARILMSTFLEYQASTEWHPTDPALIVESQLRTVRLPDFEERAKAEAKGVAP